MDEISTSLWPIYVGPPYVGTYEDNDGFEKPKREDLPTPTSPKRSKKYRPSMWVIANLKPQLSRLWVQGEAGEEVGPRGLLSQLRQTFFKGEKLTYFNNVINN